MPYTNSGCQFSGESGLARASPAQNQDPLTPVQRVRGIARGWRRRGPIVKVAFCRRLALNGFPTPALGNRLRFAFMAGNLSPPFLPDQVVVESRPGQVQAALK